MNENLFIDLDPLVKQVSKTISLITKDINREGLAETPMRNAKFYKEFLERKSFNLTTFEAEGFDQMITQKHIPYYSLCEHHMVPFFGYATVSYVPKGRIVGLSKLTRTVSYFSHDLQNQERITMQVANFLNDNLHPRGVAVSLTGRHMCMEMRGVEKTGADTTTTYLLGCYKNNAKTRNEFFASLNGFG